MMRILLIAGVAIVAMSLGGTHAEAGEPPWCAVISLGPGSVYEDCQYYSFEACRPVVLAGNRGFCNHNPRWTPPVAGKGVSHKRRVHHG
jgi:Protein of unknown function (DUF3551)